MTSFERDFTALMGFPPMAWQARLYERHFKPGALPSAVDVPTGLGKTAVMALWLIARARGAPLPRRLVYVVDRRAVVDQATAEAGKLREKLGGDAAELKTLLKLERPLPISTLRGKFVDNREWLEDPSSPAIIVGTVDMIGSRLLFEGYGVSRKMRPYHAGLLGADSLVVLDEAHLVPPFQHLLRAIEGEAPVWSSAEAHTLVPAFRLLPLSATQRGDALRTDSAERPVFRLEDGDWAWDEIAARRLNARKELRFLELPETDHDQQMAGEAWQLATENGPRRVVVFCNRRDKTSDDAGPSAGGIFEAIKGLAKSDKKAGRAATEIEIELLVGGRRQYERDDVARWLTDHGFIAGANRQPPDKPTFLIATSAGEVGVDIDADHMVCDLAPFERMVQRFGRVNRRGEGDAEIVVFWAEPEVKKEKDPTAAEQRALLAFKAKAALERLPKHEGTETHDASPGALLALAGNANAKPDIDKATTPEPLRPALTRPLVEAWSMTSLEEHTGRPEVAPWLRGWVDERPQTTLVWRTHMPVRAGAPDWPRTKSDKKEIEAFFEAIPPHESEKLETETYRALDWLQKRAAALLKIAGTAETDVVSTDADDESETVAKPLKRLRPEDIAAIALSPAGDFVRTFDGKMLAKKLDTNSKKRFESDLAGITLILDARFAGLEQGLLSDKAADIPESLDATLAWGKAAKVRVRRLENNPERDPDWRPAFEFVLRRDLDGTPIECLFVDQYRDAVRTEDTRALAGKAQTLVEHQSWAEARAGAIAEALQFSGDAREALKLAAVLHDEGKRAERWQRAFNAKRERLAGPLAKTRGPIDHAILDGYRHEFGSLPHVEAHPLFKALSSDDWRDLVLHLVAAHHGQARPVIGTRGCEDAPPSALEERARDVALRFARLQKRWGPWGLAWWEALLRAADAQASRALEDARQDSAEEAA